MKDIIIHKQQDFLNVTYIVQDMTPEQIKSHADKIVPADVDYVISTVDQLPTQGVFRGAWDMSDDNKQVIVDPSKAKQIAHEIRRETRATEFAPHDEIIMKQIPGVDHDQAEQSRAEIRERHAKLQQDIDACDTSEQLEQIINNLQNK